MGKDNNSDKHFALNQKIISKERSSDAIHLEGQQTQDRIDNFAYMMMKSFRDFQEIEESIKKRSHVQSGYDETAHKQTYISNLINQQKEEFKQVYHKASLKLEDEREQLLRERNSLSWD
ncbi:hypothetical protein GYN24_08045 [Lactococcus piscium]|uniref:Uncharacterized protein n=1 Tax=Pseudolactococcus paracarnosus TaxID=2749962 RepID=A0A7L4WEF5_9LACT|nr:hypothetical protein [Lactococcus paracarnosus]MCJ1994527.1 hypothetical protein [Lactococcus paracarnosus]QDJ27873.1 hypothetical protein BHS01_04725 [Lactococcus paracarnosus]SPC35767.1 conserved hypothetical protein [Lactococcus piscium]